jgi:hypothetical protein
VLFFLFSSIFSNFNPLLLFGLYSGKRILLFLSLCFFRQEILLSQNYYQDDAAVSALIKELGSLWDSNKEETFNSLLDHHSKKPGNLSTSTATSVKNDRLDLLMRRDQLRQKIYRKDLGFNVTASYQKNTSTPFVDAEDVVIFRQKAQVGLDWDILRGGFLDNRLKAKTIEREMEWLKNSESSQKSTRPYLISSQQVVVNFNKRKIVVLQKRQELNAKQIALIEKLWALKKISKDNYLKAIQNKTDINGQFELYRSFSEKAAQLKLGSKDTIDLPLLDIDFEKLLGKINYSQTQNTDSTLPAYLLENAKRESNYLRDIGLKTYVRYSYYDVYTQNIPNRSFMSYGVNLSLPLTFNQKEKREYYLLSKQLENFQQPQAEPGLEFLLLNYYYDYRYKLKKYFNLVEKRNVYAELIRSEKVKQEFSDLEFNPNTALFILDDYWSNTVELLDLHQDLYKVLLNIKEKIPGSEISDFTFPVTVKENLKDSTFIPPSLKGIYIWSKSLTPSDLSMVSDYIILNNFNQIIVSYKYDKTYLQTLNEFINKNYTTKISLLIGNNKLIHGGIQVYLDSMANAVTLSLVKSIHLDIEPHTLDDFKSKQEVYFSKYLQLLDEAAVFCAKKNLQLEVSIPLNYPENVLDKIFTVCSKVYLMAYENTDVDFITRKIEEETGKGKNKIVLVFRTKDFADRAQMEEHFKKFKITNTAYHDLDGLLELDKKSVNGKDQ